ncbi:hypothetical protein LTR86_009574 [Recurvomyces mirabilis]|nr:hypothetical protein LTR86_009574 [Recurvomyces mirabilis]
MATWTSQQDDGYRDASPISPLTPTSQSENVANDYPILPYDRTPGGVLHDPSGFGSESNVIAAGIIGSDDEDVQLDPAEPVIKKPTVKGALSELHHAVTDKLQYWAPYKAKPASYGAVGYAKNSTGSNKTSGKTASAGKLQVHGGEDVLDGNEDATKLGARTRIGKCTIVFNGNDAWERALRTHELHDKLHGYRLHVLRENLMDDVWSKPAYILSLLLRELAKPESERLDWILWVDADTIILNPHVPIETFLPPADFNDVHLIYTNDWNGLNNGIFPVKVSRWAVDLFSAIISFRYYRPDASLTFRDQSAMDILLHEKQFAKHIVQVPQRWFNAYQGEHNETLNPFQIRRGDLLVHFAGVGDREERMAYWLDRAEQHLDDWEMPVKSTSYPQEARDFWDQERSKRSSHQLLLSETRTKAVEMLAKTEQSLASFGNRLTDAQQTTIRQAHGNLLGTTNRGDWQDYLDKIVQQMSLLEQACQPLKETVDGMHKTLLASAHEAIFAGERDLFEAHWTEESSDPELRLINNAVQALKKIVMSPQELWDTAQLQNAVNDVQQARSGLQAKKDMAAEKANAVEAARKQVMAEAGQASSYGEQAVEEKIEQWLPVASTTSEAASVVVESLIVTFTPEVAVVWTTATVVADAPQAMSSV